MKTRNIMINLLVVLGVLFFMQPAIFAAKSDNILRIAFDAGDLGSLDPGFSGGTQDLALQDMIFNGIFRYKPGDMTIVEPDIIEKYELSKDGLTYLLHLRKGVMTHPFEGYPGGVEFTAEDLVFSIQKSGNPKTSNYAGLFNVAVPEIVDKYTAKITLKERVPNFDRIIVNSRGGCLISKKAYEILGPTRFKNQAVGTGPFYIDKFFPGQKVVLKAHKLYFRGTPKIDGIEVYFMPEVNSRVFGLMTGEIDLIEGVREQAWIDKMKKETNIIVDVFGGEATTFYINTSKKPFDNLLVRKALAHATNVNEIRSFIGMDATGALCSIIPPFVPGGLSCEQVAKAGVLLEYNPQKAKELLSQAGYPNGFKAEIQISERASYRRAMENLQFQWKKVGIDVSMTMVDHPTYHVRMRQDVNPIILYESIRPYTNQWLYEFYHSDTIVVTGKNKMRNFSHCNIVDDLLEAGSEELNLKKQLEIWGEIQLKILKNVYSYPLYISKLAFARNSLLKFNIDLKSTVALYPQITEKATLQKK